MVDDQYVSTYAYVIETPSKTRLLCTATAPSNAAGQVTLHSPSCAPLTPPKAGRYEWGRVEIQAPGLKGTWMYVMSAPTTRVMGRGGGDGGATPYVEAPSSSPRRTIT